MSLSALLLLNGLDDEDLRVLSSRLYPGVAVIHLGTDLVLHVRLADVDRLSAALVPAREVLTVSTSNKSKE
jgi:hypothetical protein